MPWRAKNPFSWAITKGAQSTKGMKPMRMRALIFAKIGPAPALIVNSGRATC
jgi:hypothetical protein